MGLIKEPGLYLDSADNKWIRKDPLDESSDTIQLIRISDKQARLFYPDGAAVQEWNPDIVKYFSPDEYPEEYL